MKNDKPSWGIFGALLLVVLSLLIFLSLILSVTSGLLTLFGFSVCLSSPAIACMSEVVSAGGWWMISLILLVINIFSVALLGWFSNKYLGISIKQMFVQETNQEI